MFLKENGDESKAMQGSIAISSKTRTQSVSLAPAMAGEARADIRSDTNDMQCKKCKSKVVNFVKCVNCDSCFHASCAKNMKCLIIDKNFVKCCEKQDEKTNLEDDAESAFFDAIDNISCNNKIDIGIFKYVIKQKDLIIAELNDKIKILKEHLAVSNQQKPALIKTPIPDSDKIQNEDKVPIKYSKPVAPKNTMKEKGANGKEKEISSKDVNNAILEAESRRICDKYVNIESGPSTSDHEKPNDETIHNKWITVEHKRPKRKPRDNNIVVGNFSGRTSVVGVEKCLNLHVYNLKPDTTKEELLTFLTPIFPGIECELLQSRHPDRPENPEMPGDAIPEDFDSDDSVRDPDFEISDQDVDEVMEHEIVSEDDVIPDRKNNDRSGDVIEYTKKGSIRKRKRLEGSKCARNEDKIEAFGATLLCV
ncbi:unnamed protein product [Phaedon cochleariae]|uniref:Uncharacterized protein n=1 Tax=Phaedon cochleariae TaxID=80249 RepID=A0A9P0DVZ2_PHACE|nr:unnamed protein product [Phaedon cochleariae]